MSLGDRSFRRDVLVLLLLLAAISQAGQYVRRPYPPKNPAGGMMYCTDISTAYANDYGAEKEDDPNLVYCLGPITTVYDWVPDQIPDPNNPGQTIPDPLDLPPDEVIVQETCTASYAGWCFSFGEGFGFCSNGLGFPSVDHVEEWWQPGIDGEPPTFMGWKFDGISTGTRFKKRAGGPTITLECEPFAQTEVLYGLCSAEVWYKSNIIVPTVTLLGVTRFDTPAALKFLTGQQVTATLSLANGPYPMPEGTPQLTVDPTSYLWGFEAGNLWGVFKDYIHTNALGRLDPIEDGDRDDAEFNFYTNKDGTTRVKCDFKFIVPEEARYEGGTQENPLGFTAYSMVVSSVRPVFVKWDIRDGTVALQPGANRFIFDGDSDSTNGQQWLNVTYNVPGGFGQVGQGTFCQLITATRHVYRTVVIPPGGPTHFWNELLGHALLGQGAADTGFPYRPSGINLTWSLPNTGVGGDSPFQPLTLPRANTLDWTSSTADDTFKTWAMYQPPSKDGRPTTWIPMGFYSWQWGGTATNGSSGWVLSGVVGSNNNGGSGVEEFAHPTWSLYSPGQISFIPP